MLTLVAGIQLSNHIKTLCNYSAKRLDLMEVWGNKIGIMKNKCCKVSHEIHRTSEICKY